MSKVGLSLTYVVLMTFDSDLINNMDKMRISCTETPSVILSQTKYSSSKKLESDVPKTAKTR